MSKEVKIVEAVARRLQISLIDDVIDGTDMTGNAVGTDGFTHIIVSKNPDIDKYPKTTEAIYQTVWARLQAGTFTPRSDYERSLRKNLLELGGVPEIDIIMQEEVDGYHIVVFTDTLMAKNLEKLNKLEKELEDGTKK